MARPARTQPRSGRRFLAALALLALAGLAAYAYLYSSAFRLQELVVSGNQRVSREQILLATGMAVGDLRWQHPPDAVKRSLLHSGLGLLDAQVKWRSGGVLAVTVVERIPVALLQYYNLFALVDGEGVVLELGELTEWQLPVVTGVPVSRALLGQRLNQPNLAGALRAASLLLQDALYQDLAEVHVEPSGDLTLVFNGPLAAKLGPPAGLEDKLVSLRAVYRAAQEQGMNIDVRNPSRPTLVPRT